MKLSKNLQVDAVTYATQGNAILGIKKSGKSYTATYIAEQLMTAGIPIIAFDPIGVWRYLKAGKNGKGFPVVVAGGQAGDLPLSADNAADIVRAAMKENVSLVIDLYSIELSKADWRRIVEQCIRLLLYENKDCGLRHVFIEEGAEFCPQVVRPEYGKVYAEIEKLARMGGNASLGFTIINQRAESINKEVLEQCECLLLHRQKGRHSLVALGKWLDVADIKNSKEIINSLPSLDQGELWAWLPGSHEPVRIHIPEKKTIHPDRDNPQASSSGVMADVSHFVSRLKTALQKQKPKELSPEVVDKRLEKIFSGNKTKVMKDEPSQSSLISQLNTKLEEVEERIDELLVELAEEKKQRAIVEGKLKVVRAMLSPQYEAMKKVFEAAAVSEEHNDNGIDWNIWLDKLHGKNKEMLAILIKRRRVTQKQLALLVGMSASSGSFRTYKAKLTSLGLAKAENGELILQTP